MKLHAILYTLTHSVKLQEFTFQFQIKHVLNNAFVLVCKRVSVVFFARFKRYTI